MILVAGATGLLGAHLLCHLLLREKNIRALYRDEKSFSNVLQVFSYYFTDYHQKIKSIEWIKADIIDVISLVGAMDSVDIIYNCAGKVSFNDSNECEMIEVNVYGTRNIVDIALKYKAKLCHVSSIATLGDSIEGDFISENNDFVENETLSLYARTKFDGETEVWRGINEGLSAVIVNPSVIVGPGMWNQSSSIVFRRIWEGLKYYPGGSTGFIDVRDVCAVMLELIEGGFEGERYIVSAQNMSYKEFFDQIAIALSKKAPSFFVSKYLLHVLCWIDAVKSLMLGVEPSLTASLVRSASMHSRYSSKKLAGTVNVLFTPIDASIQHTCKYFLKEFKN